MRIRFSSYNYTHSSFIFLIHHTFFNPYGNGIFINLHKRFYTNLHSRQYAIEHGHLSRHPPRRKGIGRASDVDLGDDAGPAGAGGGGAGDGVLLEAAAGRGDAGGRQDRPDDEEAEGEGGGDGVDGHHRLHFVGQHRGQPGPLVEPQDRHEVPLGDIAVQ